MTGCSLGYDVGYVASVLVGTGSCLLGILIFAWLDARQSHRRGQQGGGEGGRE